MVIKWRFFIGRPDVVTSRHVARTRIGQASPVAHVSSTPDNKRNLKKAKLSGVTFSKLIFHALKTTEIAVSSNKDWLIIPQFWNLNDMGLISLSFTSGFANSQTYEGQVQVLRKMNLRKGLKSVPRFHLIFPQKGKRFMFSTKCAKMKGCSTKIAPSISFLRRWGKLLIFFSSKEMKGAAVLWQSVLQQLAKIWIATFCNNFLPQWCEN